MVDGLISISVGKSLKATNWNNKKIKWSDLAQTLITEKKTAETIAEYRAFSKEQRTKAKDVGGFVGGHLLNGKRHPQNVLYRQLITLDIDDGPTDFWEMVTAVYSEALVLHGTHSYTPEEPRYRLVMPIDREVSPEEYEAIARRVAGNIGIELFDNTTFQVNRLMFWPSSPKDIDYFAKLQNGPWLCADDVLNTYLDWTDISDWPVSEVSRTTLSTALSKQADPLSKDSIIGSFCSVYSITSAIETFLSDVYTPMTADRYTYSKGSTAGGLTIYDDLFAYSHHNTDPAHGRLCNAYDLVRLHLFGHLDLNSRATKDTAKPSFKKMQDLILADVSVKKHILTTNTGGLDLQQNPLGLDDTWLDSLELDKTGKYTSTASNINLILQNDAYLKGALKYNIFDRKKYICLDMPWREVPYPEPIREVDYAGIRNYLEVVYSIVSSAKIEDALHLAFERDAFHPVQEYLQSVKWDGIPRVETLFIDYFGSDNNIYTREAASILMAAACARVFEPGIKYDLVVTIVGEQGTGKSTFLKKLGKSWFSDTFTTFQGKEAFEQIQGIWFMEMAELSGLRRTDIEAVKQFISKSEDTFRPAYGRVVETYARQCVFVGTTNVSDFLQDPTGNRRFIPIQTNMRLATKNIFKDLTEDTVDQIWAEAYQLYLNGQKLFMSPEATAIASLTQQAHSEVDNRMGIIINYLNTKLPEVWPKMDLFDRREYLNDPEKQKKEGTVTRDYVCIAELWCECLGKDKSDMTRYNTKDLNGIMRQIHDWERSSSTRNFPIYGVQKYYSLKLT